MIPLRQLTTARLRIPPSKFRWQIVDLETWWNDLWLDYYIIGWRTRVYPKINISVFLSQGSSRRKPAEVRWSGPNGGRRCSRWWRATNWSHANLSGSVCKVASRTLFKSQSVGSSPRSTGLALFTRGPFVLALDIFLLNFEDKCSAGSINGTASRWRTSARSKRRPKRNWTSSGNWEKCAAWRAMTIKSVAFTDHASREKMNSFLF